MTHTTHIRNRLLLSGLGLVFIAVYWPTMKWLWARWQMGVWYNQHGMVIPLVTGYLVWQRLRHDPDKGHEAGSSLGFLFVVPGLLLHVIDNLVWLQLLSAVSLIPALIGLSLLLLGRSRTVSILLPLLLLFFMIPIPLAASQPLILVLRTLTAIGTEGFFLAIGFPVYRTGTVIEFRNGPLLVGDPCSGLATLTATLAFTLIVLFIWPLGLRRSMVFLAIAPFIALCANVLRIVMLSFLKIYIGNHIFDTWLHPFSGYVAYFVAIGLQAGLMAAFRRRAAR